MKTINDLGPGDYVFFIPENIAILITEHYEDGNRYTCALAALKDHPKSYRIATEEEIEIGKKAKQDHIKNMEKIVNKLFSIKEVHAINFTDLCEHAKDIKQIKRALKFYNKKFRADKIAKYFTNWKVKKDDTKRKVVLTNKHSQGWTSKITINDNFEYQLGNDTSWLYVPKTISEFISDILRHEDFELILSKKGKKKIYGK